MSAKWEHVKQSRIQAFPPSPRTVSGHSDSNFNILRKYFVYYLTDTLAKISQNISVHSFV